MEENKAKVELLKRSDMKYCSKCEQWKSKSEFGISKKRKDGLQVWCKLCISENMRENRKKAKIHPQRSIKYSCTSKQFYDNYYSEKWINDYIKEVANKKTKDTELRLDLEQEAWIRLSFCPPDMSDYKIEEVIRRAIGQAYHKQWVKKNYEVSAIERMSRDEYTMWMTGTYIP